MPANDRPLALNDLPNLSLRLYTVSSILGKATVLLMHLISSADEQPNISNTALLIRLSNIRKIVLPGSIASVAYNIIGRQNYLNSCTHTSSELACFDL